jgi:hypothetical protein
MNDVSTALLRALGALFHPKMLALVFLPLIGAFILWAGISIYFFDDAFKFIYSAINHTRFYEWLMDSHFSWIADYLTGMILLLLIIPATLITALLLVSVIAMPIMLKHIGRRDFPELQLKHGGTAFGGIANAILGSVIYFLLWIGTLPLWLFGPLAFFLPVLLNAYLNKHMFRYDALAEHASIEEMQIIFKRSGAKMYGLALALAFAQLIPLINLFAPIYAGLAFIYFCLAELKKLRQAPQKLAIA